MKKIQITASRAYSVIKFPKITEKSNFLSAENKWVFEVEKNSSKYEIASSIEKIFDTKVKKVNIINVKPVRTFFRNIHGVKSGYKKAIVTLEKGSSINVDGS